MESSPCYKSQKQLASKLERFHRFNDLPVEIRLQIWHYSFKPRVVEIHGRKAHYADAFRYGSAPQWHSYSNNPAALSVNNEARAVALGYYFIRIPLTTATSYDSPGDSVMDSARALYLNPTSDTIAILGELDFYRLSLFLSDIRRRDPAGNGLRGLAVSARWTSHGGAGSSIQMIVKAMFPELVEFIVYLYDDALPPVSWVSGSCLLDDCVGKESYEAFKTGGGRHLRDGGGWMVIGESQLKVMELSFIRGW